MTRVTETELLKALSEAQSKSPEGDGLTVREIAEANGVSIIKARGLIRSLGDRVEVSYKQERRIDGRPCTTPCYKVKKTKTK